MTCHYCRALNSDDEHRCRRCGRRLNGGPGETHDGMPLVHGALAAMPAPEPRYSPVERTDAPEGPVQRPLFHTRPPQKVIPFESIAPSRIDPAPKPAARPAPERTAERRQTRRPAAPKTPDTQQSLDFLPAAPQTARKLKTTVEAVIYCDAPVATKMHRAVAVALDLSMILIGFGIFLLTFHFAGGEVTLDRTGMLTFGAALGFIAVFYSLLWALAQSESPGKRWTHLRLTNFDGFAPDATQRLVRLAGACLSMASLGAGVLWALADEESLTWHDHMSKTFLTLRGATDSTFFRQR
jgi:uncharacterized RDD family membrane protein YckC